jgi:hypothetical protein
MAMEPQRNNTTDISYQVTPTVAESFAIVGGKYYNEITNAQNELHKAHVDLRDMRIARDDDGVRFAESMVKHWSGVIEHYMALRRLEV